MPLSKYDNAFASTVWEAAPSPHSEASTPVEVNDASQVQAAGSYRGLEEPEFGDMGAAFEEYRRAYRNFRVGHWRGAKGEAPRTADEEEDGPFEEYIDGMHGNDVLEPVFAALQNYRLAYREHRMGGAHGAKGEITDIGSRLKDEFFRFLPVVQMASLGKHLQFWEESCDETAASSAAALKLGALHLHVGAGRLGLGLVLPAIVASGRPFGIVQRPSAAWSQIGEEAAHVQVRLNGQSLVSLRVVRSAQEALAALQQHEKALLVLSEELEVLQPLAAFTSSYSCSIGGKDLTGALEPLFSAVRAVADASVAAERPRPPIYCCENDHDAVAKLEDAIGEYLELVPVLVDRVCTSREIRQDGSVDVATEAYAGDLVIPPPSGKPRGALPFGGPTVRLPRTQEGAELLHRKKILTVNGTHTTLAFLTLIAEEPDTVGPPQRSHELLAFDVDKAALGGASEKDSPGRTCWVWAVARQLMLLDEFPSEVLRHTLGGERPLEDVEVCEALLRGARDAVRRLSHGGDQTSRVLGGGVVNRWQGRLANVAEWLQGQRSLAPLARLLLRTAGISDEELRASVQGLVAESRRFTEPPRRHDASRSRSRSRSPSKHSAERRKRDAGVAVLLGFDGTLVDTERPATELAFWTLAPYSPGLDGKSDGELLAECLASARENAGKAFEHMIEACDQQREAAGLPGTEATRAARREPAALLAAVDRRRRALGLQSIAELRSQGREPATLLQQQKGDAVARLPAVARPCPGVPEALESLQAKGVPLVIATTSGKPRAPACVDAAGLRRFFQSDDLHIHSGESDFDPPCFKPAPEVYLRAASAVRRLPSSCVAVEDSPAGVGSASNAGIGLIVGYVGAGHIDPEQRESHAQTLLQGAEAVNGRGADVVIDDMRDLPLLVRHFSSLVATRRGGDGCSRLQLKAEDLPGLLGKAYFHEDCNGRSCFPPKAEDLPTLLGRKVRFQEGCHGRACSPLKAERMRCLGA